MRKNVEFFQKRELKSTSYWIYQGSFLGDPFYLFSSSTDNFCGLDPLRLAPLYLMSGDSFTLLSSLTSNSVYR